MDASYHSTGCNSNSNCMYCPSRQSLSTDELTTPYKASAVAVSHATVAGLQQPLQQNALEQGLFIPRNHYSRIKTAAAECWNRAIHTKPRARPQAIGIRPTKTDGTETDKEGCPIAWVLLR